MSAGTAVVVCPSCKASLKYAGDGSLAGKRIRCPKCKKAVIIPAPEPDDPTEAVTVQLTSAASPPKSSPASPSLGSKKTEPAPEAVRQPVPAKLPTPTKTTVVDGEGAKKRRQGIVLAIAGLCAAAALYYFFFSGSPAGPQQRTVYAAEGLVRFRGKPVEGARVMFHPEEQSKDKFLPNALTGPGGEFKLTTYQRDDGAPAGKYKVAIAWTPPKEDTPAPTNPAKMPTGGPSKTPEADRLQNRYSDPNTSKLTAEIKADTANKLEFELK